MLNRKKKPKAAKRRVPEGTLDEIREFKRLQHKIWHENWYRMTMRVPRKWLSALDDFKTRNNLRSRTAAIILAVEKVCSPQPPPEV